MGPGSSSKHEGVRDLLLNPKDWLPKDLHYYTYRRFAYHATLYRRPSIGLCSKAIPITASQRFIALIGHNARSIQPLNERELDQE